MSQMRSTGVFLGASLVAHTVKNPLVMQETRVPSLGWEDPWEKRMATHSSILAWRIPRTEDFLETKLLLGKKNIRRFGGGDF